MENRFDNKVLFVLRGEQVQGGSYCIMGFPALRARTKHELVASASGRHQFEPKRDVTTRRDPPLSFFGEICVDSQPARRVASNRCEKSRNVLVIAKRKQEDHIENE